jgi:dephospho-CoA kinase
LQIEKQLQPLKSPYCIISVPLLIETAKIFLVDRVLVVDCTEKIQIARVKQRDKLNDAQIGAIIASQASRTKRQALADDIIENSKTTLQLEEQVEKLHNLYLLLSST